jgi:hypothetical protein
MPDQPDISYLQLAVNFVVGVSSIITAAVAYILSGLQNRVSKTEDQINDLRVETAAAIAQQRSDFNAHMEAFQRQQDALHAENRAGRQALQDHLATRFDLLRDNLAQMATKEDLRQFATNNRR